MQPSNRPDILQPDAAATAIFANKLSLISLGAAMIIGIGAVGGSYLLVQQSLKRSPVPQNSSSNGVTSTNGLDNYIIVTQSANGITTVSGDLVVKGSITSKGQNLTIGQKGEKGETGAVGPSGPSGIASCAHGICLSLQKDLPNIIEQGGISFSGALQAGTIFGDGSGITNLNAGSLANGILNDSRLSTNIPTLSAASNTFANDLNIGGSLLAAFLKGNGAQITNLDASMLSTGSVSDSRLSSNVALKDSDNSFTGSNSFTDPVGIGGAASAASLTISSSAQTQVAQIIQAASGQTADLLQVKDSTTTNLLTIDSSGSLNLMGGRLPTLSAISNSGLVGEYLFEDGAGTTASDTSGTGNHAVTPSNYMPAAATPNWSTDKKLGNYAANFNARNTVFTIPDSPSLYLPSSLTFESWVKFSPGNYYSTILSQRSSFSSNQSFFFGRYDTNNRKRLLFNASTNGASSGISLGGNTTLQDGRWYHVAVTYDGTAVRIYVDGQLDASGAYAGPIFNSTEAYSVGHTHDSFNTVVDSPLLGQLDNLRIYNRPLNSNELMNRFNEGLSGQALQVSTGNVGIGTSKPLGLLDIQGNDAVAYLQANPVILDGAINNSPSLLLRGTYDSDITAGIQSSVQDFTLQNVVSTAGLTPASRLAITGAGSGEALSILSNSNIGIGTIAPQQRLTLASGSSIAVELASPSILVPVPTSGGSLAAGTYYYKVVATDGVGITIPLREVTCTVDGVTTNACIVTATSAITGTSTYRFYRGNTSNGQNTYFIVTPSATGNVTFTDVGGAGTAGSPPAATTAYTIRLNPTGSSFLNGGNLGIGTVAPTSQLSVIGTQPYSLATNGTAATSAILVTGAKGGSTTGTTGQTAGAGAGITFTAGNGGDASSGSTTGNGGNISINAGAAGTGGGTSGTAGSVNLQVNGGNVGIGTLLPTSKLQVMGTSTSTVVQILQGASGQTADLQQYQTSTGTVAAKYDSNGKLNSYGTGQALQELATPTSIVITPQGVSGSTTYGYRIAAVNAAGTTLASATTITSTGNAVLSAGNFNRITWAEVTGATSYRVYGRTSGSELFIATVSAPTVSYDDNGSVTPAGALPGNPTGSGLTIKAWSGQSGDLLSFFNSNNTQLTRILSDGSIYVPGPTVLNLSSLTSSIPNKLFVQPASATTNVLGVRGAVGHTGDLAQFQDANGAILSRFSANGALISNGVNNRMLNLVVPTIGTTTGAATGGSLTTPNTYYYVVTATNATGETIASSSVSFTPGSATSTFALNWAQIAGATGYKIYRNTSNSFGAGSLLLTSIASGAVLTFTDTGAATSTGLPPTTTTGSMLVLQAWNGQSGDILQAQDSTGAILAKIDNLGNLTVKSLTVNGHIITGNTSGTTTIFAGAGADCSSAAIVSLTGNDTAGVVSITTGTGSCSTGTLATISFATNYGAGPIVTLTPAGPNAAALQYYVNSSSTTNFVLSSNTAAMPATQYKYNYHVQQ